MCNVYVFFVFYTHHLDVLDGSGTWSSSATSPLYLISMSGSTDLGKAKLHKSLGFKVIQIPAYKLILKLSFLYELMYVEINNQKVIKKNLFSGRYDYIYIWIYF